MKDICIVKLKYTMTIFYQNFNLAFAKVDYSA